MSSCRLNDKDCFRLLKRGDTALRFRYKSERYKSWRYIVKR